MDENTMNRPRVSSIALIKPYATDDDVFGYNSIEDDIRKPSAAVKMLYHQKSQFA